VVKASQKIENKSHPCCGKNILGITIKIREYTHRERERACYFTTCWVYQIFMVLIKILFAVGLKHSSFLPSADVKPM
jgi:hypothetical protein